MFSHYFLIFLNNFKNLQKIQCSKFLYNISVYASGNVMKMENSLLFSFDEIWLNDPDRVFDLIFSKFKICKKIQF